MSWGMGFIAGIVVATIYERKGWRGLLGMRWPFKIALLSLIAAYIYFLTHQPT